VQKNIRGGGPYTIGGEKDRRETRYVVRGNSVLSRRRLRAVFKKKKKVKKKKRKKNSRFLVFVFSFFLGGGWLKSTTAAAAGLCRCRAAHTDRAHDRVQHGFAADHNRPSNL
jgi:hypothetical protein